MSKNQNHGKMKAWRKPEYNSNGELIKQKPFVRRKSKGSINRSENGWMSVIISNLFRRVGIKINQNV